MQPSSSTVARFLHDASRFLLRFASIIAKAPLQIYSSALLFSPTASIVRKMFIRQEPQGVQLVSEKYEEWDACRSVLEGHSAWINAVVFSPDGQLVASASGDMTVRVWEITTGQCYSVLEGHSNLVNAVVFSPDGQLVASASYDCTVRVWEIATGQCRSVLEGHSSVVKAVVFSPDGQLVASASHDCTVRIWKIVIGQGQCRSVLKGHSTWVNAVVFSPDGQLVASASGDRIVRVWEIATGQCRSVLKVQQSVYDIAFSPKGQTLQTNRGNISLPPGLTTAPATLHTEEPSCTIEDEWLLRHNRPFLWLPPEYRNCATAVHKHMVCLGCMSGRVTLISVQ